MSDYNVSVVHAIEDAWSSGRLDALDEHFAPDFHAHSGIPGMPPTLQSAKMAHAMVMQSFPDRHVEILDTVADEDKVLVRCRVTGTNTGGIAWAGAPPNDRPVDFETWALYRLVGGQVVESWGINDAAALFAQTGVWEPPPMPPA